MIVDTNTITTTTVETTTTSTTDYWLGSLGGTWEGEKGRMLVSERLGAERANDEKPLSSLFTHAALCVLLKLLLELLSGHAVMFWEDHAERVDI